MASTGLIANPDAIQAYGAVVGRQEAALARIHSVLAGVHVPANAFGRLPEAGSLHSAYAAHAADMLEITAMLPAKIGDVAQNLHDTARSYADLESGMADGIREIFGTGSGGGHGGGHAVGTFAGIAGNAKKYYG